MILWTDTASDTFAIDGIDMPYEGLRVFGSVEVLVEVVIEHETNGHHRRRDEADRRSRVVSCDLWSEGDDGREVNLGPWERLPDALRLRIEREYVGPQAADREVCT